MDAVRYILSIRNLYHCYPVSPEEVTSTPLGEALRNTATTKLPIRKPENQNLLATISTLVRLWPKTTIFSVLEFSVRHEACVGNISIIPVV